MTLTRHNEGMHKTYTFQTWWDDLTRCTCGTVESLSDLCDGCVTLLSSCEEGAWS